MKKLSAIVTALCMVITLCSCGNQTNQNTSSKQSGIPKASKVSNVPSSTTRTPREADLNIMMSFPQYMEQWENYAKQFEKKMLSEENINVHVHLEMPSSDQYESVLQTRLSGDDAPDLYTLHCNNLGVYNDAGYLCDLSNEPLADMIYENVKKTVSIDGKLLAVPIESQAWGVLYNKAIFKKCGLTAPETLMDLKNICETLKGQGYTPFMLAFQEQWVPQLMTSLTLGDIVSGKMSDWLDRMYQDKGSYKEVREIFDVIDLIIANGTERAMEEGSEAGAADFALGKAAMFVQGTWAANTIMSTNPEMELGVFALPINEDSSCTLINLSTSTTLAVYPNSKERELALKFANYVLDENDSSALFQACSFNPLAKCHKYEAFPWVADASSFVASGRAYQDLVLPSAVTDEQGRLLQEYYVGTVTVDNIIEHLDEAFKTANKLK